ncbi:DUF5340 family protein [Richelia intracellularis]|nr:DUF5340 family protein [Richelia intracellularis]
MGAARKYTSLINQVNQLIITLRKAFIQQK